MGCAKIAEGLMIPNIIRSKYFELHAVASRDPEKAKLFGDRYDCLNYCGYEKLIKDNSIDCIYIPLPTGLHYEWTIKALNGGKHVLCEKSLATTPNEVSLMIKTAQKNQKILFENFMFPFHSQFSFVQSKIENFFIGDLRLFKSTFCFPIFDENSNIRYNKSLGGGALLDAGAYTLMAAQMFMGDSLKIESSYLNLKNEVDFHGSAILTNENNVIGNIYFGFDNFYQNNIEIYGTKGSIVLKRAFTAKEDFNPKIILENNKGVEKVELPACNQTLKMLEKFSQMVHNNLLDYNHTTTQKQANLISQIFSDEK